MKDMFKKIGYLLGLALCLVACGEDELSPEQLKELEYCESIVGKWIYDHPETSQWEETVYTSSGRIYVSFITGIDMHQLQLDRKDGIFQLTGNKLDVVYTGFNKFEYTLTEITDAELSFIALSANNQSFTYSKQLDEFDLTSGNSLLPEYQSLLKAGETVSGYKSHSLTIAEVDDQGRITAKEAGFTYIDVITSSGTYVVRVNVKDPNNLYPDYTDALWMNEQQIIGRWGKDYYYNKEDGLAYLINNDYITNVLFYLDENRNVTNYWLLLNTTQMEGKELENTIHEYLSTKYIYADTNEEGVKQYYGLSKGGLALWVLYSPEEEVISYMRMTVPDLWRDYSLDLGKTLYQLLTEYGEPDLREGSVVYYLEDNEYVNFYGYALNESTQKVHKIYAYLHENADGQAILDELLRKFVYYEVGSKPSEGLYAFKDMSDNIGIIFDYLYGYITYVDLSASASSRTVQDWVPSREECARKAKMIQSKK